MQHPSTHIAATQPAGIRTPLRKQQAASKPAVPTQRCHPVPSPQAITMALGPLNAQLPWQDTEIASLAFQQITLPPAASTGWHYHDGPLLTTVRQGTLRRRLADGSTTLHPAGTSFLEPPGLGNLHTGDNPGSAPVVLLCLFLLPPGSPLSVPVEAHP